MPEDDPEIIEYNLICPECGVGNPVNVEFCLICDRNLKDTLLFLEDDFFDLEVTNDCIIEYRKTFWGTSRTGKINKYIIKEMSELEFESKITRLKFTYHGKRQVLPFRKENMKKIEDILK